jgi:hypothetical protein
MFSGGSNHQMEDRAVATLGFRHSTGQQMAGVVPSVAINQANNTNSQWEIDQSINTRCVCYSGPLAFLTNTKRSLQHGYTVCQALAIAQHTLGI